MYRVMFDGNGLEPYVIDKHIFDGYVFVPMKMLMKPF